MYPTARVQATAAFLRARRLAVGAFLLVGSTAVASAQTAAAPCDAFAPTLSCTNGVCRLDVIFQPAAACVLRIDDAFLAAQGAPRMTEETNLRIRVLRPNLLRYSVLVNTRETEVESYVYLERLWKQVLGVGQFAAPGDMSAMTEAQVSAEQQFVNAINGWRDALDSENVQLTTFIAGFSSLTLTPEQLAAISTRATSTDTRLAALNTHRLNAKAALARVEHFAIFDATMATHVAVADRLEAFQAVAAQIAAGFERRITFGAAGRVVVASLTVKDRRTGDERPEAIDVEFFVHSTLPVTFHAGYTIRALQEQGFQTVASSLATAGGADLFSRVQDSSTNGTFTAFLSYRPCDASRRRRCPHLTLGTDFKDIGERLYGGVSWPIGRAFLTAGVVSGETVEGDGPVSDVLGVLGQATGSRELFTAISTKRKWGGFVGISFAPF